MTEKEKIRAVLEKLDPDFLAFCEAARDQLGAKLTYVEADGVRMGKPPEDTQ